MHATHSRQMPFLTLLNLSLIHSPKTITDSLLSIVILSVLRVNHMHNNIIQIYVLVILGCVY